jgi:DNA-directed RNA polymerase I and III subunit RPAC2
LGNLLRFSLIKNPEVEFCGYSITHPSEHTVNMRLQTTGAGTNGVMAQGFKNIDFMVNVAEKKFTEALAQRKAADKQKKRGQ